MEICTFISKSSVLSGVKQGLTMLEEGAHILHPAEPAIFEKYSLSLQPQSCMGAINKHYIYCYFSKSVLMTQSERKLFSLGLSES